MIELLPYILKAIFGDKTTTPGHTMTLSGGTSPKDILLSQGYTFAQTKPLLSTEAIQHAQKEGSLVVTGQDIPFKPPTLITGRKTIAQR